MSIDVFARFARETRIAGFLDDLLRTTTEENVAKVADRARCLVTGAELTPVAVEAIRDAYDAAGGAPVAVRSSAAEEDGAAFSFAGQFDTFLDVAGFDEVCARVKDCWASAFSERVLRYRLRHGLAIAPAGVAVIIQAMVPATHSGILFTADPLTGSRGEYVVTAADGLGENLMSGKADACTLRLGTADGAVTAGTGLSPAEIAVLYETGTRIDEAFDAPQDVEWAFAGGRLWLLQSRPITTLPQGRLRIWDNSNLLESFHEVTSPLTYTFAADVYARVYREYARSLRLPHQALRQLDDWLPALLGRFHGRVYYNLLNWYRMVRLAPGYRLNRKVLEVSLGVSEPLDDELAERLRPYTCASALSTAATKTLSTAEFARRFLTMRRATERFVRDFDEAADAFDETPYDKLPADELYGRFQALQRDLIERWGPMMVLDASLLLSIGTLHLLTRRWLPDAPDWFRWAVGSPGPDVASAEPVRALRRLAEIVHADPEIAQLVFETPPGRVCERLHKEGFTHVPAGIEDYVAKFGYRSVDELKLETPDLREDPASLFTLLRAVPPAGSERTADVDAYLNENLRGPRRLVYDAVRRKVATGMAGREQLRFRRARAFGMAKRLVRAIGRELARTGALGQWDDIFLLRLDELRGCFDATIAHTELKPLIALRREQQADDARLTAPARFHTRGAVYWQGNLERAGWGTAAPADRDDSRVLHGIGSSPGIVEGTAVVADTPEQAGAGILLAYRTDPGWVAALSSAEALLIERGSPLTHVAVVARELGIPTVVQVKDLTARVTAGTRLRVDGGAGIVEILEAAS